MMEIMRSVKNKTLKLFLEQVFFRLLVLFIPIFCYFELCIVLPEVVKSWTERITHLFFAMFLILNGVGNLMYAVFTDTSVRGRVLDVKHEGTWDMCTVCECYKPPRAWHCELCKICILKRDHHCLYFASCIGYYNYRYFLLFTMHTFIAMVYAFCYNLKFIGPFMASKPFGIMIAIFLGLMTINLYTICFTGFFFIYHVKNIISGKTAVENNMCNKKYDKDWKYNIVEVLGCRWYLTLILPFVHSPLPGIGTEWDMQVKKM